MATEKTVGTAIEKKKEPQTLQSMIQSASKELGRALPSHLSPERLVRIALTSIRLNPALAKCTPESFMGSLFVLAQMGIEPIAGRAYLLPFKNRRKIGEEWKTLDEVQALIGYKGLIELFYRHESALSIDMQTVHANDDFDYTYGTESFLKHKPAPKDRGEAIGYYAVGKMKGGATVFRYMSKEDAMAHGMKHSKTCFNGKFSEYSPWAKEPDTMCMKTVLIQLMKLLPLSVELQRALSVDETTREYRKGVADLADTPDTTNWDDKPEIKEAEVVDTKTGEVADGELPMGDGRKAPPVWVCAACGCASDTQMLECKKCKSKQVAKQG